MKKLLYILSFLFVCGLSFIIFRTIQNKLITTKATVTTQSAAPTQAPAVTNGAPNKVALSNPEPVPTESTNNPLLSFSPIQTKEVEQIVYNYLMNNPKILIEVGKKLQEEEQKEQKAKLLENVVIQKNSLFDPKAPGRIILGKPQGSITLIEFTQHQCRHCKDVSPLVDSFLESHPEVQLIVIYWPFFGEDAVYTAKAVLAAQKQNKGKELHQALFAYRGPVVKNKVGEVIGSVSGLDSKQLASDMTAMEKDLDAGLKENFKLAENLGITGTPAFVFANKELTKFSVLPGLSLSFADDLNNALAEVK